MDTGDTSDANDAAMNRRLVVAGLASAAVPASFSVAAPPAKAAAVATLATTDDERLMREAIALAAEADFPFASLIVRDGTILARGRNSGKRRHDPTAHGEMVAIQNCLADHGPEALKGAVLYSSGEPCPMCMGAIIWCGIGRLVYAASIVELSAHMGQIMISCSEIADKAPFAKIEIKGGVLADEALDLFRRRDQPR
jgi:tRNA(Arg) A34 adenosine deaminase TadA